MVKILQRSLFVCVFMLAFTVTGYTQITEGDVKSFTGNQITPGDLLPETEDNKFEKPQWNTIEKDNSVNNSIILDILNLKNEPIPPGFSCILEFDITYFTSPNSSAKLIENVKLEVNHSTQAGAKYKISDTYRFNNGYRVKVNIKSIKVNGSERATAPGFIQLTNSIVIDRTYKFVPDLPIRPTANLTATHLELTWPSIFGSIPGAEEYDLEWTTVDDAAKPVNNEKLFRHNATRITNSNDGYPISLIYNTKWLAVRIRQVHYTNNIRLEGPWDYLQSGDTPAVWDIKSKSHESNLNWQYSASYAEEGKKKEVISYFDGTLRGRQTATLNNSDTVAVIQENIYDEFGRPLASILPAPVKENYLHYTKDFNLNYKPDAGYVAKPYSFWDMTEGCEIKPGSLNTKSGASNYYSKENKFILNSGDKKYNKYIPDAEGYPFSVTQYTPDNTGRIRIQGGVGAAFKPGGDLPSNTTKYYYAKPEQWELDRLFGNDVGFANHYLKNMVIDPNGQVSISYLNASGKTIATALSGESPLSQDALLSGTGNAKSELTIILRPEQFKFDATSLKLKATTTYLSSIPAVKATLKYDIERLLACYKEGTFNICSNCYYDLVVKVKDDCGLLVYDSADKALEPQTTPFTIGSKEYNPDPEGLKNKSDTLTSFNLPKVGEYFIDFELSLSREVIENYTDKYIEGGQLNGSVKKELNFIMDYLKGLNFSGLGDCQSSAYLLKDETGFKAMFSKKLDDLGVLPPEKLADGFTINPARTQINELIRLKYQSLLAESKLQQPCPVVSPCLRYALLLEEDVHPPTGQYALFDKEGHMLEPELNVLRFWRDQFTVDNKVNGVARAIPESDMITISEDGAEISPYDKDFTLAQLVQYWKPEWAAKFVKYHPEHCKLEACKVLGSVNSLNWDKEIQETIENVSQTTGIEKASGKYVRQPDWLLNVDPFFELGGLGYKYRESMQLDLQQYTSRILKVNPSLNVKSLPALVDYITYCVQPGWSTNSKSSADYNTNWNQCAPVTGCRVEDREWRDYRDKYFEIKENYYKAYRDKYCFGEDPDACPVGTAVTLPIPGELYTYHFVIEESKIGEACPPQPASVCQPVLPQQRIRIACLKGAVGKPVTVQIEYPDHCGATIKVPVKFTELQSEQFICIPAIYYIKNSIKISNIIQ